MKPQLKIIVTYYIISFNEVRISGDFCCHKGVFMKLKNISLMNIFMCFCVVVIHLTSMPVSTLSHDSKWFVVFHAINSFLRFAVPAFVFLSGFKLYNRYKNEKIDLKKFYLSRFKKIILPYVICYTIYYLYFLSKGWIEAKSYFSGLVLGNLSAQFYYIIFTIQLYLLFPLIIKVFKKYPQITLFGSLLITVFFFQFLKYEYSHLLFTSWLVYFIFGMYIASVKKEKINLKSFALETIVFIISSVFVILSQYKSLASNISFDYYASLFIVYAIYGSIFFLDVFSLITKENSKFQDGIIKLFDANTYDIFLYHILFINICQYDLLSGRELSIGTQFAVTTVFTGVLIVLWCLTKNGLHKITK